jgi:hypothetical protein
LRCREDKRSYTVLKPEYSFKVGYSARRAGRRRKKVGIWKERSNRTKESPSLSKIAKYKHNFNVAPTPRATNLQYIG